MPPCVSAIIDSGGAGHLCTQISQPSGKDFPEKWKRVWCRERHFLPYEVGPIVKRMYLHSRLELSAGSVYTDYGLQKFEKMSNSLGTQRTGYKENFSFLPQIWFKV